MMVMNIKENDLEEPGRAPSPQTQEQFEKIFKLHEAQPWTARKNNQLFALLEECGNDDEKKLILDLLLVYENFDEARTHESFSSIKTTIVNNWKLSPRDTLIVAMHNSDDPSSAAAMLQQIKNHFSERQWRSENFICHLKPTLDKITDGTNIVFVDDFVGTGGQFCRSFDWFKGEVKTKKADLGRSYLVSLCIMKQALPEIDKRCVFHYASHYMEKGITGRLSGQELVQAKQLMKDLEDRLKWKRNRKKYSFGFNQSEALFRFMENNAPNNNFPIFWWKETAAGDSRHTMQVRF